MTDNNEKVNIIIYDNPTLIKNKDKGDKKCCKKEINENLLFNNQDFFIKVQKCKEKKPVQPSPECDSDECYSLTSASSFESFDSSDDNNENLLRLEIDRARVLYKKDYESKTS